MKKLVMAMALATCSLSLAACDPTGPTAQSTGQVDQIADSAMYAAEAAYNVPAHAYVEADANGLLSDELKAQVKPLLVEAYDWLVKARMAYKAKDALAFNTAKANLEQRASMASELLPVEGTE